jgi:hypothetical protein
MMINQHGHCRGDLMLGTLLLLRMPMRLLCTDPWLENHLKHWSF